MELREFGCGYARQASVTDAAPLPGALRRRGGELEAGQARGMAVELGSEHVDADLERRGDRRVRRRGRNRQDVLDLVEVVLVSFLAHIDSIGRRESGKAG